MKPKHLHAALLLAASSLVAAGAYAQNTTAAPPSTAKANAEGKVAADKKADGAKKDEAKGPGDAKGKSAEDRVTRRAKEHDRERQRLSTLKGPVTDAIRQELKLHAERVARLERIKSVAETEKDKDSVEKVTKLIAKEDERHDKWLDGHGAPATGTTATGTTGTAAQTGTTTPAAVTTGGAK